MELVDGLAGESEQRGQQRECSEEDEEDGDDAGGGQPDHVGLADEEEPEERDDDRAPGEEDRASRRHQRDDDGITGPAPFEEPLPVARGDEQRVVDAHADADHGGHLGGKGRDDQKVGHQLQERDTDSEAEEGRDDRQPHGHDRSEGQQHDEDGRGDPDAFAGPWCGRDHRRDGAAPQRDLEPAVRGRPRPTR